MNTSLRCAITIFGLCATLQGCATAPATAVNGEPLHAEHRSRERCFRWQLDGEPSRHRWTLVLDELDEEPDASKATMLRDVARVADTWPDRERRVPSHWLLDTPSKRPDMAALVRHLDTGALPALWRDDHDIPELDHITTLTLVRTRQVINLSKRSIAETEDDPVFPKLTHLVLRGSSVQGIGFTNLLASPMIQRVEHLEIKSPLTAEQFRELANTPMPALEHLTLRGMTYTDDAERLVSLEALAQAPYIARLETLDLSLVPLREDGAEAFFARLPMMKHLGALALARTALGTRGVKALGKARTDGRISPLERIDLSHNELGDEGIEALVLERVVHGAHDIDLAHVGMDDVGAMKLARGAALRKARALDVSGNRLTSDGLYELTHRAGMLELTEFILTRNTIGAAGAGHLASSAVLQNLKRLDLRYAGLTDAGVLALSQAKGLDALRELDLEGNDISSAGIVAMREATWVRKLSGLGLSRNPLEDPGVLALARLPVYLRRLEVSRVAMGDEGLDALLQASAVRLVEELDLTHDKLGTPENLARMVWTPMAAHIQHIRITLSRLDFGDMEDTMRTGDLEDLDTQLLVKFADLPQLGERMITSPYLSASLRRLIARVLLRAHEGLDEGYETEQVPAAIYYIARGYIQTMSQLNDTRRVLP